MNMGPKRVLITLLGLIHGKSLVIDMVTGVSVALYLLGTSK